MIETDSSFPDFGPEPLVVDPVPLEALRLEAGLVRQRLEEGIAITHKDSSFFYRMEKFSQIDFFIMCYSDKRVGIGLLKGSCFEDEPRYGVVEHHQLAPDKLKKYKGKGTSTVLKSLAFANFKDQGVERVVGRRIQIGRMLGGMERHRVTTGDFSYESAAAIFSRINAVDLLREQDDDKLFFPSRILSAELERKGKDNFGEIALIFDTDLTQNQSMESFGDLQEISDVLKARVMKDLSRGGVYHF